MTLYLLRHGLAEPPGSASEDRKRRLIPEGVRRIELQAAAFARAGLLVERIFCSPYVRARQTAEIVARAFGKMAEEDARLASGASVDRMMDLIGEQGSSAGVMLVGHQPDLGYLTYALTGSTAAVREGSLIVIEARVLRPNGCTLAGLYDPAVMASLGRTE